MSRPQLLPESPSEQETSKFLRRFSELVAIGQSASYLRHAAGLIDELIERVRQTEDLLSAQAAANADNLARRHQAESDAAAARAELARRNRTLADLQGKLAQAESVTARAEGELRRLQARLAPVGNSHAIIPLDAMRVLRTQWTSLAGEFQRRGDLVSDAMCQIGICAIDRALAGEPERRPPSGRQRI
jgi:ABC-type transporter Mla subunit MlaD